MSKTNKSETALGMGAVAAMALCCGGPVLIAGGALGAIGGFFSNPVVITIGILVIAGSVVSAVTRLSHGQDDCCGPTAAPVSRPDREQLGR